MLVVGCWGFVPKEGDEGVVAVGLVGEEQVGKEGTGGIGGKGELGLVYGDVDRTKKGDMYLFIEHHGS